MSSGILPQGRVGFEYAEENQEGIIVRRKEQKKIRDQNERSAMDQFSIFSNQILHVFLSIYYKLLKKFKIPYSCLIP